MVGPLAAYAAAQPHLTHHLQDRLIGEGIPPGQLGHIFERFYRGGAARSRDNGGAGIGLTISKALIEAHGGTLTASSPGPGRGAVFALHPLSIYPRGVYAGEQHRCIPPTRRSFPMITSPPRLLPMASHGCSCCGPASHADTASIPAASDSSAGGSSSSYQVTGLTCGHCAKSVTQALQALPQVDDVQVDLAAGGVSTVTVTGVVPPEMVRRAIEATGYTVLS